MHGYKMSEASNNNADTKHIPSSVLEQGYMRAIIAIVVMLAGCYSLPAVARDMQDLVGTWIIQPPSPPGIVLLQTVTFSEAKGVVVGSNNVFGSSKRPSTALVSDLKMIGDTVSFKVGDEKFYQLWEGSFAQEDELHMKWFFVQDGKVMPVSTRVFRRSSTSEITARKAALPKNIIFTKLPLPKLRDLPPNGLAQTPPMGWSSWNRFLESIDDKEVRETADALVSSGLRDSGYTLVEVDDGWQGYRDDKGLLHSNSKFPDMKSLSDYVHSKGLKLGIYTTPGPVSCGGYVGSHGYETQDAHTFANWGVDFVMNDACSASEIYKTVPEMQALHQKMAEELRATGRPIVYKVHDAMNVFDDSRPLESWGRKVGANLWRTGGDLVIGDRWKSVSERFERHGKPEDAGPGGWNDADNLVIGLDGVTATDRPLTLDESRTHMTLWSILASPLILGNDVRSMTDDVKSILMNKEVIAVDQDVLGKQGRRVVQHESSEVWAKPLSDGSLAVALFNRGAVASNISVTWSDLGLHGTQKIRDIWRHADLGELSSEYSALVPSHGGVLLRLKGIERAL